MSALFPMEKWRFAGVVAILTFGLTSLVAVLGAPGSMIAALSILGFFLLLPLIALLGSDFPLVAAEDAEDGREVEASLDDTDPVEVLRERYARGELSEEEFESRLDRLLATEDVTTERSVEGVTDRERLLEEES
ncbi:MULTISPECIES: SHOCT domain-containing protein [Halomicrobium]|uniref:SHOCT domain-containing protein n=1 Tax=Halomicrobium mukohataei TaxID=57705 RepID=A0A847UEV6_9EURY|nr:MULTISPECIES: SHOCT domain-containing protein [Halomicrobium]NLV09628.1 SHOCT domain-containing protein [Halomicrobium mukohataei]QGA81580.1 putative membrane protein [Halomicrobium sp. LC1Hm]